MSPRAFRQRPKIAPRPPQDRPRTAKERPKTAKERLKTAQERPKTAPRRPKSDPRSSKTAPRPPKSDFASFPRAKTAPRGSEINPPASTQRQPFRARTGSALRGRELLRASKGLLLRNLHFGNNFRDTWGTLLRIKTRPSKKIRKSTQIDTKSNQIDPKSIQNRLRGPSQIMIGFFVDLLPKAVPI